MARQISVFRVTALGLAAVGALAQSDSAFKFSGFGSLAATQSSEKNADFISNFSQPNGPGFTRGTDFGVDSRLGAQVNVQMGEGFSAVVQAVSERRYNDTYDPYLSMAHLKFRALPGLSFRAGRVPFTAYLISDYQKVGYSLPWVRPPVAVYQFNPLVFVDGVDLLWQANAGEVALSGQVVGGSSLAKGPGASGTAQFKGKDIGAASVTANYGSATFRVFYLQMKGTYEDSSLDGPAGAYGMLRYSGLVPTGLPAPYPPYVPNPYYSPVLADQYQLRNDKITYLSVGFNYDPGDWFVMAEGARNAGDVNQLAHATAGYITAGYRFGAWTPYVTASWRKTDSPTTNANPIVGAIIAGTNSAQSGISGGLRWDFYKNMALKAQLDRLTNADNTRGGLVNLQPAFKKGESYNITTIALDFVF